MLEQNGAKVGGECRGRESCMYEEGLGEMNENGLLFSDFCMENELVIGGTIFPHRDIRKYNWESPGQEIKFILLQSTESGLDQCKMSGPGEVQTWLMTTRS
jgi:hypothetical protein